MTHAGEMFCGIKRVPVTGRDGNPTRTMMRELGIVLSFMLLEPDLDLGRPTALLKFSCRGDGVKHACGTWVLDALVSEIRGLGRSCSTVTGSAR